MVLFGQHGEIGGLRFKCRTARAGAFAIGAVTYGAILEKFRPSRVLFRAERGIKFVIESLRERGRLTHDQDTDGSSVCFTTNYRTVLIA